MFAGSSLTSLMKYLSCIIDSKPIIEEINKASVWTRNQTPPFPRLSKATNSRNDAQMGPQSVTIANKPV